MCARVLGPWFYFLIEQDEEQPGEKDLNSVEELIDSEGNRKFICFLVIDNSVKTGICKNCRAKIDDCVRIIRDE